MLTALKNPDVIKTELTIRSIKMVDIGFITVLYFILGYSVSLLLNKLYEKFIDLKEEDKPTYQLVYELLIHVWIIGIFVYIARNVVEEIPSPLHGIKGFDHYRVKELHSATTFTLIIFYSQPYIHKKINILYKRLSNNNHIPGTVINGEDNNNH
jgi:hypothetical protein